MFCGVVICGTCMDIPRPECTVCSNMSEELYTLQCGHTVCQECLNSDDTDPYFNCKISDECEKTDKFYLQKDLLKCSLASKLRQRCMHCNGFFMNLEIHQQNECEKIPCKAAEYVYKLVHKIW